MDIIKPGNFGASVAADVRRCEFDIENEELIYLNKKTDFLFIGDSITHYWNQGAFFQTDGFIVNRGIGGDSTPYLLRRFDADALQLKPGHIILLIGINDILTTHPDLWWRKPGRDRGEVISEIKTNIESIVQKCKHTKLTLCSVLPVEICQPYDREMINDMVLEVNRFLRELCNNHRLSYADYHSAMCESDGKTLRSGLSHDGVHPNGKGYEIMAKVLADTIKF